MLSRKFFFPALIVLFLMPVLAQAESCDTPPEPVGSGRPAVVDPALSGDNAYLPRWCNDPIVGRLWRGLSLDEDLWNEGWGYHDACNVDRFLARLFGAAWLVREHQRIAKVFGGSYWWDWLRPLEDDGYEPKCSNDRPGLNATHFSGGFGELLSTNLTVKWAYRMALAPRSSTLIHEATHAYEGHIDDGECPNEFSCDDSYGRNNANTNQINYMEELLRTYDVEPIQTGLEAFVLVNDQDIQRRVTSFVDTSGNNMCQFIPLVDDTNRTRLISEADRRLRKNFRDLAPVFPYSTPADVDSRHNVPWQCDHCDRGEYTYNIDTWGQNRACNETVNSANIERNRHNRQVCDDFNTRILHAPGRQHYSTAVNWRNSELDFCASGGNHTDLRRYCASEQASAGHVRDIDERGFFTEFGFNDGVRCVREWCQTNFNDSWIAHSEDRNYSDPLGCVDAICADDATCRHRFLRYRGDPRFYGQFGVGRCANQYLSCIEEGGEEFNLEEWPEHIRQDDGASIVEGACKVEYDNCRFWTGVHNRMLAYLMRFKLKRISLIPPVMVANIANERINVMRQLPQGSQAAFSAEMARLEQQVVAAKGLSSSALEELNTFMSYPESRYALFRELPQAYVALYGKKGQEAIVGPKVKSTRGGLPKAGDLDAEGKMLLQELEREKVDRKENSYRSMLEIMKRAALKMSPSEFAFAVNQLSQSKSLLDRQTAIQNLQKAAGG